MTTYQDEGVLPRERIRGALFAALGAFTRWRAELTRRSAQRRAIVLMTEMPDWQLRDIGLHRGDVERLVAEHRIEIDRPGRFQPH